MPNHNMERNNAARRLLNILKLAIANGKPDIMTYCAIAKALDIKDPDTDRHLFTEFFVLLNDVEHLVKQLKKVSDLDEYIDAVKEIQSLLLSSMFQATWNGTVSNLTDKNLLRLLSACANLIDHEQANPSLSEEQLQKYLQECETLLQEITESDLPDDIKTFLVIRFEEICSAIRHYSIGGPERLRTVIQANIGGILLRSPGMSLGEKEKPIFNKVVQWLLTLGGVLDLAANTQTFLLPKVAEMAKNLLPSSQ